MKTKPVKFGDLKIGDAFWSSQGDSREFTKRVKDENNNHWADGDNCIARYFPDDHTVYIESPDFPKSFKMWIDSPETSLKVQEKAFELGWKWCGSGRVIIRRTGYIYFDDEGDMSTFGLTDWPEITAAEFLGVDVASDTSKSFWATVNLNRICTKIETLIKESEMNLYDVVVLKTDKKTKEQGIIFATDGPILASSTDVLRTKLAVQESMISTADPEMLVWKFREW